MRVCRRRRTAVRCPTNVPERYQKRISGPLRDRIDLCDHDAARPAGGPRRSGTRRGLRDRGEPDRHGRVGSRWTVSAGRLNGRLRGDDCVRWCVWTRAPGDTCVVLADLERASGRGTERLLRVARTIADLAGAVAVIGRASRRSRLVSLVGSPALPARGRSDHARRGASGPLPEPSAAADIGPDRRRGRGA